MPEIRYRRVFKNSKEIAQEPYEVSDEELAEEAEVRDTKQIKDLLTQDWDLAQTQTILKKLIIRLFKKGVLP